MPPPIVILRARAEARAALFGAGMFPIEEAMQPLLEYADERDLSRATVEIIITEAFTPYLAQD
jgi:hypothetical protein